MRNYRDGSFTTVEASEMGPIMPLPRTVRNWTPGMGDMPPPVYPVMPLPRVVYQWSPGMTGPTDPQGLAGILKAGLVVAAVVVGVKALSGGRKKRKRRR